MIKKVYPLQPGQLLIITIQVLGSVQQALPAGCTHTVAACSQIGIELVQVVRFGEKAAHANDGDRGMGDVHRRSDNGIIVFYCAVSAISGVTSSTRLL